MSEPPVNPMSDRKPETTYEPAPRARARHAEGSLTRVIEQQTAKLPSSLFLTVAIGSMVASVAFEATGKHRWSQFVGMWAPTLLIAGVYNKLVKTFGTA